jgi:predicted XRE-type DNA-binding protein
MARKRRKHRPRSLFAGHLKDIKRGLLEGEKREPFLEFLSEQAGAHRGIYALYDERGRLYYAGKASDLPKRLDQHLRDRHSESWDRMTLFVVKDSTNVGELEGLVVATAKPPGNKQKPKIGQDMRKSLRRYLKRDAASQIDEAIFPERELAANALSQRISTKKLRTVKQARLARVLGISQPRVSTLLRDRKMRAFIRETGKRDSVLLLLPRPKRHA